MEISCFPSSALRFSDLRCHQIVASPRLPAKLLGRASSKYSQISPSHISISGRKGCSVLLPNSKRILKPPPLQVQATLSDISNEVKRDPRMQFAIQYTFVQFSFMLARRLVENPHVLQGLNWLMIIKILAAFVSVACANFYMIGINDIYDVEIDKVNRPDLRLSSRDQQTAWLIMLCLVSISLLIAGISKSVPFVIFIFASHFLSSIYSIPPLRTKVSTLGAPATNGLRYDPDPAAKAAAASVLASKLRADSGLKVYLEDETVQRTLAGMSKDADYTASSVVIYLVLHLWLTLLKVLSDYLNDDPWLKLLCQHMELNCWVCNKHHRGGWHSPDHYKK